MIWSVSMLSPDDVDFASGAGGIGHGATPSTKVRNRRGRGRQALGFTSGSGSERWRRRPARDRGNCSSGAPVFLPLRVVAGVVSAGASRQPEPSIGAPAAACACLERRGVFLRDLVGWQLRDVFRAHVYPVWLSSVLTWLNPRPRRIIVSRADSFSGRNPNPTPATAE